MRKNESVRKWGNFRKSVVLPSLLLVLVMVLGCIIYPKEANGIFNNIKTYLFDNFSWVYILGVSIFIIFLFLLALSKYGDVQLGADDDEPEYPFFSWVSMLFAAGMGIGLMYFGVAEPILHYTNPLHTEAPLAIRMEESMLNTFFHWGVHAWAIYTVVGLTLAYFGFRYQLPLTIRSGFYPLLKDKIYGPMGNIIDCIALCCTIFGLTTTLGYGAMQLGAGLIYVGVISSTTYTTLLILIVFAISLATLSAISGVGRGVRRLSEGNLFLALTLLLFVAFVGPTVYLLSAFTENIGVYMSNLIRLSFRTFAYDPENRTWFDAWTVIYWAWWISWAPFVGLFIAKISKGRSIREFILGVLLIPTLFNLLWMTIFGNAAIWLDQLTDGTLTAVAHSTESLLFAFFQQLPFSTFTSILSVIVIIIFFVTSADSGIFVLNSIASMGKTEFPRWQSIFWGVLLALSASALLYSGGLEALQTMTVVIALPFVVVMCLLCLCMWRGLLVDEKYFSRGLTQPTSYWTGLYWKERLQDIIHPIGNEDVQAFMQDVAKPAFTALVKELRKNKISAEIEEGRHPDTELPYIEFIIRKNSIKDFVYGINCTEKVFDERLIEDKSLPNIKHTGYYDIQCYFSDGRKGHTVKYMRKEELITDVLRQYERYMHLVTDESNRLYVAENTPTD